MLLNRLQMAAALSIVIIHIPSRERIGMVGIPWILAESCLDENRCHESPMTMETNVAELLWGSKTNVEMKMHFTVMLLLLCIQWQKRIRSNLFQIPFPRQRTIITSFNTHELSVIHIH